MSDVERLASVILDAWRMTTAEETNLEWSRRLAEHVAPLLAEARREGAVSGLREAADTMAGAGVIIVNGLGAGASRREWAAEWLRARADRVAADGQEDPL